LLLFNLQAKWVALILVGIDALVGVAQRDVAGLLSLGATAGFAYACVLQLRGPAASSPGESPGPRSLRPRAAPPPRPSRSRPAAQAAASARPVAATPARPANESVPPADMAEVDALLDKIAHSGMGSLTAAERARLDAAHQSLKRRSSSNRS
jgi:hypothetical protein